MLAASLFYLFLAAGLPPAFASPDLILEPGDQYDLPANTTRVWIENPKILRAHKNKKRIYLKPLLPGQTTVRIASENRSVLVRPPGSNKKWTLWSKLIKSFVGVEINHCSAEVCLTGTLYRLKDYERLLHLMEQHQSPILLGLEIPQELQSALIKLISARLRSLAITPLKIQFTKPWKIFPTKKPETDLKFLGLQVNTKPGPGIADNIRVAVKIMEISKSFERQIGVHWPDQIQAEMLSLSSLELALDVAQKNGEAKILASPTLICRSGKSADFFAGGEFPIKILGPRSKQIQWKTYGISLKLKPLIDALGQMSLEIDTEVSSVDPSISVDSIPALQRNRVSSFFDLVESRTIAISGLIKSETSRNSQGLPWLQDLPVLGPLFSSRNFQTRKSELIIFVTPSLLE